MYVDIGLVRFEREFVVICDCKRQPQVASEPSVALTGVRVILKRSDKPYESHEFAGQCQFCGNIYRLRADVRTIRGETREALDVAAAP